MQRMPILSDSDMSLFELKTRYVRNYLTFAGKNSKDFLLYLSAPGVYDSPVLLPVCMTARRWIWSCRRFLGRTATS